MVVIIRFRPVVNMPVDQHYDLESYAWPTRLPTTVNQREGNIPKAVEHNELDCFEVRFNETDMANPKVRHY